MTLRLDLPEDRCPYCKCYLDDLDDEAATKHVWGCDGGESEKAELKFDERREEAR